MSARRDRLPGGPVQVILVAWFVLAFLLTALYEGIKNNERL